LGNHTKDNWKVLRLISLSILQLPAPKVTGHIRSSVSFGFSNNTFQKPVETIEQPKRIIKLVTFKIEQIKQKIKNKIKYFKPKDNIVFSDNIFGTIYNAKSFLTATSRLSVDKKDVSPLLKAAHFVLCILGGFLMFGGIKWQF
jgi:hypothetical protein